MNLNLTFEGKTVRMVGTTERPEWVAKDACEILAIANVSQALSTVPHGEKGKVTLTYTGNSRKDLQGIPPTVLATVTEPGLYRLIFKSQKPEAQRFQAWVVGDVLPTLRKYGQYPAPSGPTLPAALNLRDTGQLQVLALQLSQIVSEAAPKVEFYDRYAEAAGSESLQNAARILKQPPNKWIKRLMHDGFLFKRTNRQALVPYAPHLEAGIFVVKTWTVNDVERMQTRVTPKGIQFFARKLHVTVPESLRLH